MDIKITGNPGTGNTFQEIHINHVETLAPSATTVINNHYGDRKPERTATDSNAKNADRVQRQAEIMQYVNNLKPYVAPDWKNRYDTLWRLILQQPEVSAVVCDPGKQRDTTFNRDLVANIIYIMCNAGIIAETNATTLTLALEGDKAHSVRAQLRKVPQDSIIEEKVKRLFYDRQE